MKSGRSQNNVIQFPVRKKDAETPMPPSQPGVAVPPPAPNAPKSKKTSKAVLSIGVLAIGMATAAVNHSAFQATSTNELASHSSTSSPMRGLASIDRVKFERDAVWEKNLAERLASVQVQDMSSRGIGRGATLEEKLRWGILEEKYTIKFKSDAREIDTILLQDESVAPSYILDRAKFLNNFGPLFDKSFASAKLKSVEKGEEKTVESYTLFDSAQNARGEAQFELDRHKRLISLKVQ